MMVAKKEPSGRRPVPAKAKAPGEAQSAAERRAAEAKLRELYVRFAPSHLRLIGAVRRWLQKRLPAARELVYEYADFFVISYSPSEHGHEGVLGLRANEEGVRLFFNRATELPDPAKLLQGTGKLVRAINVDAASTLARPEVISLVDEAIARNPVPFAPAGPGPVVIRSTSASQRRG